MFKSKSRTPRALGWLVAASMLIVSSIGCSNAKGQTKLTESEAIDIARSYVEKNLPADARVLKYQAFAFDRGDTWGVTFMPPGEPQTGGVPEIYVDKKTLEVVKVRRAM